MTLLVIAAGGALGAVSRYLVGGWVQGAVGTSFPWGTVAVNVAGSFLLGFLLIWLQNVMASTAAREFLALGFLGSFTTFSAYSWEAAALLRGGDWWRAGGYTAGSVFLGLVGVFLGMGAAHALHSLRG
ncbi:MAG: fluoride efflux transporter CrcB [Gemmatimonadota bacterium]|nr:fluoride efflux transporter CrcB [Gemmatimonadota bacterium]MDH5758576.1 fluoride efflux transporter CrcB [Gemmatimonadota bacterium]